MNPPLISGNKRKPRGKTTGNQQINKLSEKNTFYKTALFSFLLLGLATPPFFPDSTFAFVSRKDLNALHERFDQLESKIDSLRKNDETMMLNQASFNSELDSLHVEINKIYGLTEVNYKNISESLNILTKLLEEELQKVNDFNQAYKEIFQKNLQSELEKVTSKIADLASIYKTSTQEEIERDNEYNQKMEEINTLISQLIQIYKDTAIEETARQESLMANFNSQLGAINKNISQLINIYKQSISTVTASNKDRSAVLKKQLTSINSKIKQLTEIYKATIKENNTALRTLSQNLSKELQSINNKLSKPKRSKSSATKK